MQLPETERKNQAPVPEPKPPLFSFSDINWVGLVLLVIIVAAIGIVWTVITGLSQWSGNFGSFFTGILGDATLFPGRGRGFGNFIRLLLLAVFVLLGIRLLGRKK